VIEAIEQASYYHDNLDELMEAAGRRITQLLRVPWATVCPARPLPKPRHRRVRRRSGPRAHEAASRYGQSQSEVILPRSSRNEYFHAVRAVGVRFVEVDST
jgi:hypothetical protein